VGLAGVVDHGGVFLTKGGSTALGSQTNPGALLFNFFELGFLFVEVEKKSVDLETLFLQLDALFDEPGAFLVELDISRCGVDALLLLLES
jgi:hypothetical protein